MVFELVFGGSNPTPTPTPAYTPTSTPAGGTLGNTTVESTNDPVGPNYMNGGRFMVESPELQRRLPVPGWEKRGELVLKS